VEPITPELALVDPNLAARWRRAMPDPPDCLARIPSSTTSASPRAVVAAVAAVRQGANRRRAASLAVVVGALVLVALTGIPTLNALQHRAVKSSAVPSASSSPALGGAVSSVASQELHWPRADGVVYYDLVVFANGRPVGTLRTTSTAAMATSVRTVSGGRLGTGAYAWVVIGSRADGGGWTKPLAQGSFRISA
jgi:hypothetical protein